MEADREGWREGEKERERLLAAWGIEKHVTSAGKYCHGNVQTIQSKASEFHSCLPEHHCVDLNSFRVASDFSPIQLVDTRVWI